jgi:hypothetical protein
MDGISALFSWKKRKENCLTQKVNECYRDFTPTIRLSRAIPSSAFIDLIFSCT